MHRSKYLAPRLRSGSLRTVSAGLNRVVSVRNSRSLSVGITHYFFLRLLSGSVFGLSSPILHRSNYPIPAFILYKICFFIASMIYFICECEVKLTFIVNNICAAKNTFGCFLFAPLRRIRRGGGLLS